MIRRGLVAGLLFAFLSAIGSHAAEDVPDPTTLPEAPLYERVLNVPGNPERPAALQVTLYTPMVPVRFPWQ